MGVSEVVGNQALMMMENIIKFNSYHARLLKRINGTSNKAILDCLKLGEQPYGKSLTGVSFDGVVSKAGMCITDILSTDGFKSLLKTYDVYKERSVIRGLLDSDIWHISRALTNYRRAYEDIVKCKITVFNQGESKVLEIYLNNMLKCFELELGKPLKDFDVVRWEEECQERLEKLSIAIGEGEL